MIGLIPFVGVSLDLTTKFVASFIDFCVVALSSYTFYWQQQIYRWYYRGRH